MHKSLTISILYIMICTNFTQHFRSPIN